MENHFFNEQKQTLNQSLVKIQTMNPTLYSNITDALVKDGYIIIEDALDKNLPTQLLNYIKTQTHLKKAGISNSSHLHIDTKRRRDKTQWLDEDNSVQTQFLTFTQELQNYLNRSLYLGLSYYEAHFALYEKDDFYEKHLDSFQNSKNRVVTTVYYLNDNWKTEDGGELVIYNKEGKEITKVTPKSNTLVIFMSEEFPHEVLPANKERYSIAGWFRIDR